MPAKKHKAKQVEIRFASPEPFALQIQTTQDGDRVAQQAAQLEADKQQSDKRQTSFV